MRWNVVQSEVVCPCRVFDVRRDRSRAETNQQEHDFYVLEARDWVNVVPLTADERVILVRQFRHGIRDLTLEVPAGVMDSSDASAEIAARRELREETGYEGGTLVSLGSIHPNPAILNNRCHIFLAPHVRWVGAPQWDSTEEIEVESVPLAQVPEMIRTGLISNALTVAAFHLLHLAIQQNPLVR